MCDLMRIHKTYSTAYNPQPSGTMERCNRTLLSMLRIVVSEQQDNWDNHLPEAICAYRSTPHASTGISTHKMVYGIEMTFPLDFMLGDTGQEQANDNCPYQYVEWIKDSLFPTTAPTTLRERLQNANAMVTEIQIE